MPTEDAYSSGHLVLSHFGTCMCSNVETNLSWTCLVSGLLNFEHPSVLLFCLTLLPNLTFYLIVQGFHRTYATGAACQQRTLTPPGTWSRPTLGLACVLMSRPISPELVLSPDLWISNIPRYFSFAAYKKEEFHVYSIRGDIPNNDIL